MSRAEGAGPKAHELMMRAGCPRFQEVSIPQARAPQGHARAGACPATGVRDGEGADGARSGSASTGPGGREGEAPPDQPLLPRPRPVLDGLLVRLKHVGEASPGDDAMRAVVEARRATTLFGIAT